MICPYCANEKTEVISTVKGLVVERFRRCSRCGRTFCTVEKVKAKDDELIEYEKTVSESIKKPYK